MEQPPFLGHPAVFQSLLRTLTQDKAKYVLTLSVSILGVTSFGLGKAKFFCLRSVGWKPHLAGDFRRAIEQRIFCRYVPKFGVGQLPLLGLE